MSELIEQIRRESVENCFAMKSFSDAWPRWKRYIATLAPNPSSAGDLLNLGDSLSDIFRSTADGRGQGAVSSAGYAWEALVCWYLNLCLIGSNGVVYKNVSSLPISLKESMSVNHGNFRSNTESDLTMVIFPNSKILQKPLEDLCVLDSDGKKIKARTTRTGKIIHKEVVDVLAKNNFDNFELGIIQCKTNWKDNSQIPMLWGMVYESDFSKSKISVGTSEFQFEHLAKFTYSFCTVPTGKLTDFTPTSTTVNRVKNLSGGNYWGRKTSLGVASSVKEIFNSNFRSAFQLDSQRKLLNKIAIPKLNTDYKYFDFL
jgi:hypothetical protein